MDMVANQQTKTQGAAKMPKNPSRGQSMFRAAAILLFVAAMSGCGPILTWYASVFTGCQESPDSERRCERPEWPSDELSRTLAQKFAAMAWFADVVYRRDKDEDKRDHRACYVDPEVSVDMPRSDKGRWVRWRPNNPMDSSGKEIAACLSDGGLYYETYVYFSADTQKATEAVIAFRGTENNTIRQALDDWMSNVASTLGI